MMRALPILARLRFLRGAPFDAFGYQEERRIERDLILSYRSTIDLALAPLSPATLDVAVRLASLPQRIRGYGHVKAASIKAARREQEIMMRQLASQADPQSSSAIRC
jgi:indolepyruvate ferredoxin oxidoreductase